jgi:heme/copper-type cytochrome/quinol oxidase subunit 4
MMNMTTGELMMMVVGVLTTCSIVTIVLIVGTEWVLKSINGDLD